MYPTVVILLVETQRSMVDVCEVSPSGPVAPDARPTTLGHLSCVVGSMGPGTADNERS